MLIIVTRMGSFHMINIGFTKIYIPIVYKSNIKDVKDFLRYISYDIQNKASFLSPAVLSVQGLPAPEKL